MAMLKTAIWGTMALGSIVVAHPAGNDRRDAASHAPELTVYDETLAQPTVLRNQVMVFLADDGSKSSTKTEDVMVLPTQVNKISSAEKTTITTVTGTKTSTVTIKPSPPLPSVSGLTLGPGPVQLPPGKLPPAVYSGSDQGNSTTGAKMSKFGVSYAPYRANHACKEPSEIANDLDRLGDKYGFLRIYGTDCDQVSMVYKAAKKQDMKLFLGIWDPNQVQDETEKIVSGINGDWDAVHAVGVGNELVNNGQASPEQVISAMKSARSLLRAAGYDGPVATVDTFLAAENNPSLCDESDVCAVNAHPFFDATMTPEQSGRWLQDTVSRLKSAMSSSKPVMITETGWPTNGIANGLAVPGMENQNTAINSIQEAFKDEPGNLILFSAFNDLWKTKTAATFDADQYWGIDGAVSDSDKGF